MSDRIIPGTRSWVLYGDVFLLSRTSIPTYPRNSNVGRQNVEAYVPLTCTTAVVVPGIICTSCHPIR